MNTTDVITVAHGISDFGMMAVTAAFFLLLSAAMMVAIFKWFKAIINQMMQDNKESLQELAKTQTHRTICYRTFPRGCVQKHS